MAITDDPARAQSLVPEQPQVSDSIHDTELAFGALMQGSRVTPKSGLNRIEVVATMLQLMAAKVQEIQQSGGIGTPQDVRGLMACAQYVTAFIQLMAADAQEKSTAKAFGQALGKLMNEVKAFAQRQQEAAQKAAQQGNGGMDPKDLMKIKAMQMQAQTKQETTRDSHAQRTAQRQLQWQQEMQQRQAEALLDLQKKKAEAQLDLHKKGIDSDLEISAERQKQRMRSTSEE